MDSIDGRDKGNDGDEIQKLSGHCSCRLTSLSDNARRWICLYGGDCPGVGGQVFHKRATGTHCARYCKTTSGFSRARSRRSIRERVALSMNGVPRVSWLLLGESDLRFSIAHRGVTHQWTPHDLSYTANVPKSVLLSSRFGPFEPV